MAPVKIHPFAEDSPDGPYIDLVIGGSGYGAAFGEVDALRVATEILAPFGYVHRFDPAAAFATPIPKPKFVSGNAAVVTGGGYHGHAPGTAVVVSAPFYDGGVWNYECDDTRGQVWYVNEPDLAPRVEILPAEPKSLPEPKGPDAKRAKPNYEEPLAAWEKELLGLPLAVGERVVVTRSPYGSGDGLGEGAKGTIVEHYHSDCFAVEIDGRSNPGLQRGWTFFSRDLARI